MKYLITCLLLAFASTTLDAQSLTPEVVATAGETFSNGSLTLEWTLGEIMTESYVGNSLVLTQGFHQPTVLTTNVEEVADRFGTVTVYPNPTPGGIVIERQQSGDLHVLLSDLSGRVILQRHMSDAERTLDLSHLPQGMYLLRLSDGQQAARSIRIQKL